MEQIQITVTDEALPILKSGIALKEKLLSIKAESYLERLKKFEKKHNMTVENACPRPDRGFDSRSSKVFQAANLSCASIMSHGISILLSWVRPIRSTLSSRRTSL